MSRVNNDVGVGVLPTRDVWRITLEQDIADLATTRTNTVSRVFLFRTAAECSEWWSEKDALQDEHGVLARAVDHDRRGMWLSPEEFSQRSAQFLANAEEFVEKWGNHRVPADLEISINRLRGRWGMAVIGWPVVHVHESGMARKLMIFEATTTALGMNTILPSKVRRWVW